MKLLKTVLLVAALAVAAFAADSTVQADEPIVIMTPPPALCFDEPIVIMTPPPAVNVANVDALTRLDGVVAFDPPAPMCDFPGSKNPCPKFFVADEPIVIMTPPPAV